MFENQFEELLKSLAARARNTVKTKYAPLYAAGYTDKDVCHYVNTVSVMAAIASTISDLAHMINDHESLPAAELMVALLQFGDAHTGPLTRTNKLLGDTRQPPTNGAELIRGAIEERDALVKKLKDRAELKASLHETH